MWIRFQALSNGHMFSKLFFAGKFQFCDWLQVASAVFLEETGLFHSFLRKCLTASKSEYADGSVRPLSRQIEVSGTVGLTRCAAVFFSALQECSMQTPVSSLWTFRRRAQGLGSAQSLPRQHHGHPEVALTVQLSACCRRARRPRSALRCGFCDGRGRVCAERAASHLALTKSALVILGSFRSV